MVEDLRLRQHPVGVEHEVAQQLELGGGDLDDPARPAHLVRVVVELEVMERQRRGAGLVAAGPPQDGADAGHDLLEAEGLGDVVVAAHREPLDLVLDRVTRGDKDDRQQPAGLPQPAGHLEPVHVGEHDVEDDEVGVVLRGAGDRRPPVAGHGHVEAGEPQRGREQLTDVGLVLDDEERGFGDGRFGQQAHRRILGRFPGRLL